MTPTGTDRRVACWKRAMHRGMVLLLVWCGFATGLAGPAHPSLAIGLAGPARSSGVADARAAEVVAARAAGGTSRDAVCARDRTARNTTQTVSAAHPAPADPIAPAAGTHARERDEHLRYVATWNGLPVAVGELVIAPAGTGTGGDAAAVRLSGRAETTPVLDLLWRMRDSFEATVATDPPAPARFVLRQRENRRRRETTIVHDGARARLVGEKRRRNRAPRVAEKSVHPRLHDPASLAYVIRTLPDDLATTETYEVFTGSDTYAVSVTPAGRSNVTAVGRTWPAHKFRLGLRHVPDAAAEDAAAGDQKTGKKAQHRRATEDVKVTEADLWISAGPERLPLRLAGRTFWGWVAIDLIGRAVPHASATGDAAPPPRERAAAPHTA